MADLIREIKDTSLPTLLVISGLLFLVMAVAGRIAGRVEVAPPQQKWAAVIGIGLLTLGIVLDAVPIKQTTRSNGVADAAPTADATSTVPAPPTDLPSTNSPFTPSPHTMQPPSVTSPPSTAPTPADPSPEQSLIAYWSAVGSGQYRRAWEQLSPTFQSTTHGMDFQDYEQGYYDMQVCRIETTNVLPVRRNDQKAIVRATIVYYKGPVCARSQLDLVFFLIHTESPTRWLIDRVDLE